MATHLSSTGKRECGKEWQSEKKALLLLLHLPLGIIVLCSSIVRPALAKISVVRLLLLLRSLIRSNIEPNASRPPSAASTAAAASFVLVTFYCPWDTKVLVQGTARPLWPQCTACSRNGWVAEDKMIENII